jgi:hypothetical protein
MESDEIDYAERMHQSLLGVIRDLLIDTAREGLPGDHHFYLTFDTNHPGVGMPDHLRARHPSTMTIVLQHQYWDLTITDERFSLQLSFNGKQESLSIPFDALTSFVDPSVQFGLPLRDASTDHEVVDVQQVTPSPKPSAEGDAPEADTTEPSEDNEGGEGDEGEKDNVITLDRFRKP